MDAKKLMNVATGLGLLILVISNANAQEINNRIDNARAIASVNKTQQQQRTSTPAQQRSDLQQAGDSVLNAGGNIISAVGNVTDAGASLTKATFSGLKNVFTSISDTISGTPEFNVENFENKILDKLNISSNVSFQKVLRDPSSDMPRIRGKVTDNVYTFKDGDVTYELHHANYGGSAIVVVNHPGLAKAGAENGAGMIKISSEKAMYLVDKFENNRKREVQTQQQTFNNTSSYGS